MSHRSKTKESTAEQAVKAASEAAKQALPRHQTQPEYQGSHKAVRHAVQSSTRNVPPVSVVREAISAARESISVALLIGVNPAGVNAPRKKEMTMALDQTIVLLLLLLLLLVHRILASRKLKFSWLNKVLLLHRTLLS